MYFSQIAGQGYSDAQWGKKFNPPEGDMRASYVSGWEQAKKDEPVAKARHIKWARAGKA